MLRAKYKTSHFLSVLAIRRNEVLVDRKDFVFGQSLYRFGKLNISLPLIPMVRNLFEQPGSCFSRCLFLLKTFRDYSSLKRGKRIFCEFLNDVLQNQSRHKQCKYLKLCNESFNSIIKMHGIMDSRLHCDIERQDSSSRR